MKRLTTFAVKVNLIRENHGGFRENYSTIDNMFLLYSLIELSSLKGDVRSSFTIVRKNVNIYSMACSCPKFTETVVKR